MHFDKDYWVFQNVQIRGVSATYFPIIRLNTEIYRVYLRIQYDCRHYMDYKTPYVNTIPVLLGTENELLIYLFENLQV